MNWPSYLEDIIDRALESPPSYKRKLPYEVAISAQRIDAAGARKARPTLPSMDAETAKWLKELRARRADEIEADRRAKQALKEKLAAAEEARQRKAEGDARDWLKAVEDVEPLKRR